MKAIRVHEFGGPEALRFEDVPEPTPKLQSGWGMPSCWKNTSDIAES